MSNQTKETLESQETTVQAETVNENPNTAPATERANNWLPRTYFVQNQLTSEITADNMNTERQAKDWIRSEGSFDTPYIIGYVTKQITPIVKSTRIVLR